MKVMLLMGRGIEGTGNTHWTIEMEEYYKSLNNYEFHKILLIHKKNRAPITDAR